MTAFCTPIPEYFPRFGCILNDRGLHSGMLHTRIIGYLGGTQLRDFPRKKTFFQIFRYVGAIRYYYVLCEFPNGSALERDFLATINKAVDDRGSFYRTKSRLLRLKLIAYCLDANDNKVISLTPKGKRLADLMDDLAELWMQS